MRMLVLGDLAATGFGTVTADLGTALLAQGVDVRFVSQNEVEDLPAPFKERTLVPPDPDYIHTADAKQMQQIVTGHAFPDGWEPEIILMVSDYKGAEMVVSRAPTAFMQTPTLHYCPIEGGGLPPTWMKLWQIIEPVAMSKFGQAEIGKVIGREPAMIYHGVDTQMYHQARRDYPLRVGDALLRSKSDAKRHVHADPDRIMLYRADRFVVRKRFASMLRAAEPILGAHKDVDLVLHCRSEDWGGNLDHLISKLPASIHRQVIVTDVGGGLSRDMMAALYNAADVYVTTGTEGFGLTIAEAIACGTPAVGLDYSAVPEVIGPAGVAIPIAGLIDNEYDHWWAAIDEDLLTAELEHMVTSRSRRERLGALGPPHVKRLFSWAAAAQGMMGLASQRLGKVAA